MTQQLDLFEPPHEQRALPGLPQKPAEDVVQILASPDRAAERRAASRDVTYAARREAERVGRAAERRYLAHVERHGIETVRSGVL